MTLQKLIQDLQVLIETRKGGDGSGRYPKGSGDGNSNSLKTPVGEVSVGDMVQFRYGGSATGGGKVKAIKNNKLTVKTNYGGNNIEITPDQVEKIKKAS